MSFTGAGSLCVNKTNISEAIYQEVLEKLMLPSANKLYIDANSTHAHTANNCFIGNSFPMPDRMANLPDLNSIEKLQSTDQKHPCRQP